MQPQPAEPLAGAPVRFMDLSSMAHEVWPEIGPEIVDAMLNAEYIGGPAVEAFERDWADYCHARHCVGVANGTDALLLTLEALGVGPGDEVLVPANTFIATAEAVVRSGAVPRFVDVEPGSLLVTAEALENAVTWKTRAIIVVHLYGQMADMGAISAMARRRGLLLVEDAAQAHGATWDGHPVGHYSAAACFSFYPGKNLGAFGDAGAVITNDEDTADRVRALANHGRRGGGAHYEHDYLGTNSRLDVVQAITLRGKLAKLDEWTQARQTLARRYRDRLEGSSVGLLTVDPKANHVYHLFVVEVDHRDEVRAALAIEGVQTGVHYPLPCHLQPPLKAFADGPLPVSESSAERLVSLPLFPHLTTAQVDRVCDALLAVMARPVAATDLADR